jgi:hypothetical protein
MLEYLQVRHPLSRSFPSFSLSDEDSIFPSLCVPLRLASYIETLVAGGSSEDAASDLDKRELSLMKELVERYGTFPDMAALPRYLFPKETEKIVSLPGFPSRLALVLTFSIRPRLIPNRIR